MAVTTNETYVPLSRGIVEHLEEMGGTALTIYIYLLCRAKHTGKWKGKARVGINEISIDLGIHRSTTLRALKNHLIGKYLTMIPAKNQVGLTEFTILKYKTVQDFKPIYNNAAGCSGATSSATSGAPAVLPAAHQQIVSSLEPQGLTESQECKELEERKELKKNPKNICAFFEIFWKAYPRKENKKKAKAIMCKISPDNSLQTKIIESIESAKQTKQWREGIIPHPTTWLNGERWNDEYTQIGGKNNDFETADLGKI